MKDQRLAVIGGGNMGRAVLAGVLDAGVLAADRVTVVDVRQEALDELREAYGVGVSTDVASAATDADVVLLAVKPFVLDGVLDQIAPVATDNLLVMSIIAGAETSYLIERLGGKTPVVRAMPNLPATVGAGARAICGGATTT